MTGNLLGEEINQIVDTQIKFRQQLQGAGYLEDKSVNRSPEVLNYLNNRNSWVKFASGVSISGSAGEEKLTDFFNDEGADYATNSEIKNVMSTGLAENIVLFNTVQRLDKKGENSEYIERSGVRNSNKLSDSINKMYGGLGGNSRGLQPVPGIIDVSIDCLNRGSIKKATVTLKAYNKFQFSLIEILYLRLGYMMMLEWGWDKYVDDIKEVEGNPPEVIIKDMEDTIIDNQWFGSKDQSQDDILGLIDIYESRYKGNYGGFFGKVVNFSWKLNSDNTYDITVNLITLGSVIESLKVNIPVLTKTAADISELKREYVKSIGDEYNKLDDDEKDEYTDTVLSNLGSDAITQWVAQTFVSANGEVNYSNDFYYKIEKKVSVGYVRLGHFLNILQNLTISKIQNGESLVSSLELDFDEDDENIICGYEENLISLTPNKVLFKVKFSAIPGLKTLGRNTKTTIKNYNAGLAEFATVENGVLYGKLLNCYIEMRHLVEILNSNKNQKGEVTLFKFLEGICNSINESTGNLTDITPIIKNNKIITFIDENPIKGYDNLLPKYTHNYTQLEINGYNNTEGTSNFVKDFKVQTKITPNLASMISIGAAANGSNAKNINAIPYRKWNKGLNNRFAHKYVSLPPPKLPTKAQKDIINLKEFKKAFSAAILDGTAKLGFWDSSYSFTYKGYDLTDIGGGGWKRQVYYQKNWDSENNGILSEGFNKYKKAIKLREAKKDAYKKKGITLEDDLESAKNSYSYYLINAFGGELTQASIEDIKKKEKNEPNVIDIINIAKLNPSLALDLMNSPKDTSPRGFYIYPSRGKYWEFNDSLQTQGNNSFKLYLNAKNHIEAEKSIPVISGTGFIPLELGITMDGISGINIFNKINVNTKVLPASYPRSLKFLAIGVNHKISGNLWDTELKTISVPVLSEKPPLSKVPTSLSVTATTYVAKRIFSYLDTRFKGNQKIRPIQNLVAKYESNGDYYIANSGGEAKLSTTDLKTVTVNKYLNNFSQLSKDDPSRLFAIGRYQYTPDPIRSALKAGLVKGDEYFTPVVQERLANTYFFTGAKRKYLKKYLLGENSGNQTDLERAVQDVGLEWASMPVMWVKVNGKKEQTGNIVTGIANKGYYGRVGANPAVSHVQLPTVVNALIQSRILSGHDEGIYKPPYFDPNPTFKSF